jgi:2-polyprenyl-3-methyl-5-hydroxy-6-metoxy-1,4-benzoquinol methylase
MIGLARASEAQEPLGIDYIVGDGRDLEVAADYDLAVAAYFLNYAHDRAELNAMCSAKRIGPGGRVVATDISRPMLDVASSKLSSPDSAPITYIESPAAPLGVDSAAFDFVLCQQGLQFFPDRLAALSEMRRALKPGAGTTGDRHMVPCRSGRFTPPLRARKIGRFSHC